MIAALEATQGWAWPFARELAVAVFGAIAGALVIVLGGNWLVARRLDALARQREEAESLRSLTVEMFKLAIRFHVLVDDVHRQRKYGDPITPEAELDRRLKEFRESGRVLEARIRVIQTSESLTNLRWLWHCIMDLLTMRFFLLRHPQRSGDLQAGQVAEHEITSGRETIPRHLLKRYLDPEHMLEDDYVKSKFTEALDELIAVRRKAES